MVARIWPHEDTTMCFLVHTIRPLIFDHSTCMHGPLLHCSSHCKSCFSTEFFLSHEISLTFDVILLQVLVFIAFISISSTSFSYYTHHWLHNQSEHLLIFYVQYSFMNPALLSEFRSHEFDTLFHWTISFYPDIHFCIVILISQLVTLICVPKCNF